MNTHGEVATSERDSAGANRSKAPTYMAPLTLPSPQREEGFFAPISGTGH